MISRKTRGNRIGSCDEMSPSGLGRAKTVSMGVGFESKRRMASGRDRSDQRLDPNDIHYPGQVIGEDREGHLGGHLWERFGQEVRRPHACFHRAERMFDCLSTLTHGFRVCIKPLLHGLEQMLVLPPSNPPLWPRSTSGFERTSLTGRGPVTPQHFAVFFGRIAI